MVTQKPKKDLEQELEGKLSSIQTQREEDETREKALRFNLPYLNLRAFPIDQTAVFLIDETAAAGAGLIIISKKGQELKVALTDPGDKTAQDILDQLKKDGYSSNLFLVSRSSLAIGLQRYNQKTSSQKGLRGVINLEEISSLESQIKNISDLKDRIVSVPVTQVLSLLLAGALKIGASDMHIEPEEKEIRLRYRLDGILNDIVNFSKAGYEGLLSRIKIVSGLKVNVHVEPQDGRFTIRKGDTDIEVRVSVLPGSYGENVVMRVLDPTTIRKKLEELGMREDILAQVKKLLAKTTGAILTTGPTGSGKTTTLYAFLRHVNGPGVKIITIEDPIEYHIEGISQSQVDARSGYTFANGLRSIVRQDPDVILVGEIRDKETAGIAMQAALTGHLVFSTLHTNNAAGAIPRLLDLDVKPETIAPAINGTLAQRLVRCLCQNCRTKEKIKNNDLEMMKKYLSGLSGKMKIPTINENTEIYYPRGCQQCNSTGYKGRVGVFEFFEITDEMEDLILKLPTMTAIERFAKERGMTSLLQDGILKVLAGVTSLEEVMRVVGE